MGIEYNEEGKPIDPVMREKVKELFARNNLLLKQRFDILKLYNELKANKEIMKVLEKEIGVKKPVKEPNKIKLEI
jgi:hypothetical protein